VNVQIPAIVLVAACCTCACYESSPRRATGDASTDPPVDTAADSIVDTATDDVPPDTPTWVDRDVPDRLIDPVLLFAALPDIAWNGERVGLVYGGMPLGSSADELHFIPLDARGAPVGPERTVLDGSGLTSAFPRIASAGDGNFLFSTVSESGPDHVFLAVLDEDGTVLRSVDAPPVLDGSLSDIMSPPIRMGSDVFLAASVIGGGDDVTLVYRFSYADLAYEDSEPIDAEWDAGEDPVLIEAPSAESYPLLLLTIHPDDLLVSAVGLRSDLGVWGWLGLLETPGPVSAHAAASNEDTWWSFVTRFLGMDEGISLTVLEDGEPTSTDDIESAFYGHSMDADASDRPARGCTFVLFDEDDTARVYVDVGAETGGGEWVRALVNVSDPGEGRLTDMPFPAIAWTDGGFLVVWDDWREGDTYALYGSFVELVE